MVYVFSAGDHQFYNPVRDGVIHSLPVVPTLCNFITPSLTGLYIVFDNFTGINFVDPRT